MYIFVDIPLFQVQVVCYIGEDEEQLALFMDTHNVDIRDDDGISANGYAIKELVDGVAHHCIWLSKPSIPLLVHEVSHMTDMVMESRGTECGEVRALINEYLVESIHNGYRGMEGGAGRSRGDGKFWGADTQCFSRIEDINSNEEEAMIQSKSVCDTIGLSQEKGEPGEER